MTESSERQGNGLEGGEETGGMVKPADRER